MNTWDYLKSEQQLDVMVEQAGDLLGKGSCRLEAATNEGSQTQPTVSMLKRLDRIDC